LLPLPLARDDRTQPKLGCGGRELALARAHGEPLRQRGCAQAVMRRRAVRGGVAQQATVAHHAPDEHLAPAARAQKIVVGQV
jgi:hypothetical protein